jgi:3-oxoacyl-[acyl-carrier-protein] synthase II
MASTPVDLVGVGAVTGYGWGFDTLVKGVGSGESAARPQTVDGLDVLAATLPEPPAEVASSYDAVSRFEQAALFAVDDALADARSRGWTAGGCVGVLFCTGIGDIRTIRDEYFRATQPRPSVFSHMLHTSTGSLLAQRHGWTGPNFVLNAACSSGNAALQLAQSWLTTGMTTDVIVAGVELCLIAEIITGFRRMRVLLADGAPLGDCRPFQEGSRRFFLGEAGIAMVLSSSPDPADGNAGSDADADGDTDTAVRPRATYLGGAITHDAFHLVAPEPEAVQLERCYREAIAAAGLRPADIGLVKAHGSGTPINDQAEAALLDRMFPPSTQVCSYKPLVGHAMALAALSEMAGLLAGYEIGALPHHVTTTDQAHPRLADGDRPPDGPVLCGSVGLGGANTAAVIQVHQRHPAPPVPTGERS